MLFRGCILKLFPSLVEKPRYMDLIKLQNNRNIRCMTGQYKAINFKKKKRVTFINYSY